MVKVKLSEIVDGIQFQTDESRTCLRKSTGEVVLLTDEEIRDAEANNEITDHPEWYKEAIEQAKEYLKNESDYILLPSKYGCNDYRVMEKFINSIPIEKQREELYHLIKGKGAFSRFRQGLERFLLLEQWYEYKDKALNEFAEYWCQENGIEIESEK